MTPVTASNTYYDMAGDGRQHRTAWAAAGNAVLVYDTNGDGQITRKNRIPFAHPWTSNGFDWSVYRQRDRGGSWSPTLRLKEIDKICLNTSRV